MYGLQACFIDDCTNSRSLVADGAVFVQADGYACRHCKEPTDARVIMVTKATATQLLLVMKACPYDDLTPASLVQMGVCPSSRLRQCA